MNPVLQGLLNLYFTAQGYTAWRCFAPPTMTEVERAMHFS